MGLFSKIFGGAPGEQGDAPEGDATIGDAQPPERTRARELPPETPGRESVHARATQASAAPASPEPAPAGNARANAAPRGARPSLSANVEARVHNQPSATTPMATVKVTAERPAAPAQRSTAKKAQDVSPSPPPVQVGPPPKPPGASRGPVPPASRAPAKKVTMTATLPLGSSAQSRAPKPAGQNGAARAKTSEALVLEPLGASAPPPAPSAETDDVDNAFDRIAPAATTGTALPGALADDAVTKAENAKLFSQMVIDHARPLREFMLELTIGPTTKQWLDVTRPATESIVKGARALEQHDLEVALSDFQKAMNDAAQSPGSKIGKTERTSLMSTYEKLAALLPAAFEVKGDRDRREPLVVHHLLMQIPGIHKVTIDKLYAAGLASLEALCRASADDLVAIGRVEMESANAIIRRFQTYWRERTEQPFTKFEERTKRRLRELVDELGKAHQEFQRAEVEEDRERKRSARNARRERALAMNVLLAQLGEVDLVEELERSPTERRISRVQTYIEHSSANGAS